MTTQDMDILARKIVSLEKRHNSLARAQQLPNSSVRLVDGDDVGLAESAEATKDFGDEAAYLGDWLTDADNNLDDNAEYGVEVPEWIQDVGHAGDVAWDGTQFATDLALTLDTELTQAKQELEQAQIDLTQALGDSATALQEAQESLQVAEDAVTAATDASAAASAADGKADSAVSAASAAQSAAVTAQGVADQAILDAASKSAAAESAAKAYADAEADAARLAAIAAASGDATAKADAAQAAAEVAAAADALTKANAAQTAAEAKALTAQQAAEAADAKATNAASAASTADGKATAAQTAASNAATAASTADGKAVSASAAASAAQGTANAAIASASAALAATENFIKDPNFVNGADDLVGVATGQSDANGVDLPGSSTTFGVVTGNDNWARNTMVRTVPGHTYRFEVWVRVSALWVDSDQDATPVFGLMLWKRTVDGYPANTYAGMSGQLWPISGASAQGWVHVTGEWTAPVDNSWEKIRPSLRAGGKRWLATGFNVRDVTEVKALDAAAAAAQAAASDAAEAATDASAAAIAAQETADTAVEGIASASETLTETRDYLDEVAVQLGEVDDRATVAGDTAIAALEEATLTTDKFLAAHAAIGEAYIGDASILDLAVEKLTVTENTVMSQAVIERLFADVVTAKVLQLTEQLLGKDGTFTGRVTASHLQVETLFGQRIDGLEIHGGEFVQYATDDFLPIYPSPSSLVVVEDWFGGAPEALAYAVSDPLLETGVESARVSRVGAGSVNALWRNNDRVAAQGSSARRVDVRLRSNVALTDVHVNVPNSGTPFGNIPANTWVTVSVEIPQGADLSWLHIGGISAASATLYIDRITILSASLQGAHVRISRNASGIPGMFMYNAAEQLLGQFTPNGMRSVEPGGAREAVLNNGALSLTNGGVTTSFTSTPNETVVNGLLTGANEFMFKSELDAWVTAKEGTRAWVTTENREYIRSAGAWEIAFEDTGWLTTGIAITASAGFSLISYRLRRHNGRVCGQVLLKRTGAELVVGSTGNLTDTTAFTFPAGWRQDSGISLYGFAARPGYAGFTTRLQNNGAMQLTAGTFPGQTLATDHDVAFDVDYTSTS